jgi:uncharacterized membrane protein YfcA
MISLQLWYPIYLSTIIPYTAMASQVARQAWVYLVIVVGLALIFSMIGITQAATSHVISIPLWYWPVSLFFLTLGIGMLAPMAGVGGGVMFVPITSAFWPFHMDFVRGCGLCMAITNALTSSPKFLRTGLGNIRVALPLVTVGTGSAIAGACLGLYITQAFPYGKYYIKIALGAILFFILAVMVLSKRVEFPEVKYVDKFSRWLGLRGYWYEPSLGRVVEYHCTRAGLGMLAFVGVGFLAGMFGLGAGWANVPVLNLILGMPIKAATSTSLCIITMTDAAPAAIYLAKGAILPLLMIPAVLGMYIGSRIGAWSAVIARPRVIKYIFFAILVFAAIMDIYKGLHGLHMI